jgi:YaiO family outer membrane protein
VLVPEGAAAAGKKAGPSLSMSAEHNSYTDDFGTKSLLTASLRLPLGTRSSLAVAAAAGERRTSDSAIRSTGVTATLSHQLLPGVVSRTHLSGGEVGPLFARLAVGEELAVRSHGIEMRGGLFLSQYAGESDVRSLRAGAGRRIGPVTIDYGLAAYEAKGVMPRGLVQRLTAGLEDRLGGTELQLGSGTSLHEHDWRPDKVTGSFRSVGLKRKQKLLPGIALELGSGWTAFERPKGRYGALKMTTGLVFKP